MAKEEWGSKRICQSCGAKFYDFKRDPIHCPSCKTRFDPETLPRVRRSRPAAAPKPAKPVKPVAAKAPGDKPADEDPDDDLDVEVEDAGDDDLIVDADASDGDDADVGIKVKGDKETD